MATSFTIEVKKIIKDIPKGKVSTYGLVAAHSGNPRAARQVARILHSSSRKDNLPWHRVVNRNGQISLKLSQGFERQKQMLQKEGVVFDKDNTIDLDAYLWQP
jgi:methylated-DNA-protein-cysteine methyltransferase related protein